MIGPSESERRWVEVYQKPQEYDINARIQEILLRSEYQFNEVFRISTPPTHSRVEKGNEYFFDEKRFSIVDGEIDEFSYEIVGGGLFVVERNVRAESSIILPPKIAYKFLIAEPVVFIMSGNQPYDENHRVGYRFEVP